MASSMEGKDTEEENRAIRYLLSLLKSTVPGDVLSKADDEYKRLQDCALQLETHYRDKYKWYEKSGMKKDSEFDTLTPSQKDQARGILDVIRVAKDFQIGNEDEILKLTDKAKQELFSLIDAYYLLKMFKDEDGQKTETIETEETQNVKKGSRSRNRFDGMENKKDLVDEECTDQSYNTDMYTHGRDPTSNQKNVLSMERTRSVPEADQPPGMSTKFKPYYSASEPTHSNRSSSLTVPYSAATDDVFHRFSRSLSDDSRKEVYDDLQPSLSESPTTSTSSKYKRQFRRSCSENSAEDQEFRPILELAQSYRMKGSISVESFQEIQREYDQLTKTKKNFSMKFSRMSSMRLSSPMEDRNLEDLPDDPKSSYHNIKRFLRTAKRDVQYQDAVNECAELVETEQRYCLAKSTNVNIFNSVSDIHGNIVLTKKQFEEMQNEIAKKTQEADELSSRLSRMASQQMNEGNPNIADLSDRYRPTKIGEMFGQLYDDEWSEAYEALKEKSAIDEDEDEFQKDVLKKLAHIVKAAFEFSVEESEKQFCCLKDNILKSSNLQATISNVDREMEAFCVRTAKEVRKKLAGHSWRKASEKFKEKKIQSLLSKHNTDTRLLEYIDKCIELTWYMCVQDPPMSLVLATQGQKMDTTEYCYHGRKGKVVDMCVWPSLRLHKDGPLVCKGYVLPQR